MAIPGTFATSSPRLLQFRLVVKRAAELTRRAGRGAREATPVIGWTAAAVFLGVLVGFSAVVLPPTGAFSIPAIAGLVLLWAMPDLFSVPRKSVRVLFFAVLIVDLCVPTYYAIAGVGLPWISVRRIVTFPLILAFALVVAGSSADRARIRERLAAAKVISFCAIGFFVMVALSVLSADAPVASVSPALDAFLTWYVPFFALIYIVRDENDFEKVLRVVAWCAIYLAAAGIVEYFLKRRIFIDIMPKQLVAALMDNNPTFQAMVNRPYMRNGIYRSSSVYTGALSFGEFEAMAIPLSYYFVLHGQRLRDRALGYSMLVTGLLGLIACNARGSYVALIAATPLFAALWVARKARFSKGDLAPAIVTVLGAIAFTSFVALIFVWGRLYNNIVGGHADSQASNQARFDQWNMAMPHILSNPLTGHGFGNGAEVVGYFTPAGDFPTLDSSLISFLVETGVPGLLLYFGMALAAIALAAREYVTDPSPRGAIAGSLACALTAYVVDRLVLSQRENQTTFYLLVGMVVVLLYLKKTLTPSGPPKLEKAGQPFQPKRPLESSKAPQQSRRSQASGVL